MNMKQRGGWQKTNSFSFSWEKMRNKVHFSIHDIMISSVGAGSEIIDAS